MQNSTKSRKSDMSGLAKTCPGGQVLTANQRNYLTGSAAKRSGRCIMVELKERGVPGGEGTGILPGTMPADR